jgi:hypothetical protein
MSVDWYRGLRAGAKLGPVIFMIELGMNLLYTEVILGPHDDYSVGSVGMSQLTLFLIGDLIIFMVLCVAIGVLFAFQRERLPGVDDTTKAIVLFVPAWSLITVVQALIVAGSFDRVLPYYLPWVLVLCLMSIPYGYLLGRLWDREEPTED